MKNDLLQHKLSVDQKEIWKNVEKYTALIMQGNMDGFLEYFHNNYSSAFFNWSNDFSASQIIMGTAFLQSSARRFKASITMGMLSNYLYWNEFAFN